MPQQHLGKQTRRDVAHPHFGFSTPGFAKRKGAAFDSPLLLRHALTHRSVLHVAGA